MRLDYKREPVTDTTHNMSRREQKKLQIDVLLRDHARALEEFRVTTQAREARMAEAFQIHVTCMDERDTFASEATGEPLGAMELYASAGGKVTPETLFRLYGKKLADARAAGKEVTIFLMPHMCGADAHAGCAAFQADTRAQEKYFSTLAENLTARFEGAADIKIITAFYDTDTHALRPFHGSAISEKMNTAAARLRTEKGQERAGADGDLDRQHAGNRIYVGDTPRAWIARRNVAYHLHGGSEPERVLDDITLAIKVIKTHSHVKLETTPIVIQIDRHPDTAPPITMHDAQLLARLNASSFLRGIEVSQEEVLIVRTETDPRTWEGKVITEV